jgi:hypothetical protein
VLEDAALAALYRESTMETNDLWSPYPSKLVFLLDAIDNIPRLRVSAGLMNVILWLLQEVGVPGVPKACALRKFQESLRENKGVETIHCRTSAKGNAYSFNNPVDIISNVSFTVT